MTKMDKRFYKGKWNNAKDDCMLCHMTKKTEWHLETPNLIVAEKLSGGPFVVWKEHKESLDEDEMALVEHVVELLFGEAELAVRVGLVPDHAHVHILPEDENIDLSDE